MSFSTDSEPDQSSHSDSEDSIFVPESRNGDSEARNGEARNGRKRHRLVQGMYTDSGSDTEDTIPVLRRRRRSAQDHTDSEEPEDATAVPGRGRRRTVQERSDSEEPDEGRRVRGHKRTRRNAIVIEAVWTPEKTVRITYDIGVKHACMNPIHGKAKASYQVLHLVSCPWKHNVSLMKAIPSTDKSKPYQYTHKLCEACMEKYGPHCFKCDPSEGDIVPILNTVFGEDAVTSVEDFLDSVKKWQQRRDEVEAAYLVLHCTVLGPEARFIRQRFSLKRWTVVHIVYSDVRDRMEPAGSGQNLEDSMFQNVWKMMMKERVHSQDQAMVSFFGNILLNNNITFKDFRVNDLLVMYQPNIFGGLEGDAMRVSINTLSLQLPLSETFVEVAASECCLRDAVVHMHREPMTVEDDGLFQHGNLIASLFYKGAKRYFGDKIIAEFEHRAGLGEALKIGEEGQKLPFRKLFAARGGEVQFRRVGNATQDVARRAGDARSRVCTRDTSGYELVCWTSRGAPGGGDFVIPGLMYRFETNPGSSLIFRPKRYFHATLPTFNRDLKNEKFAAAFVTPT